MIRLISILGGAALALLVAGTFLPLLRSDAWWIRMLDFPRMQIAAGIVITWALMALAGGLRGAAGRWLSVLAVVALAVQGMRLWPYQPLAAPMAPLAQTCAEPDRLRVLVANVRRDNRHAPEVLAMVRRHAPDIFLALETNTWWNEALAPLEQDYPGHIFDMPQDATYYGMHLFSAYPLEDAEMRYPFGTDTPLLVSRIAHPSGTFRFFGVHPRPPQRGQSTTMRDAIILEAAIEAGEGDSPAIVAGDLNATSWERTARRALRLGQLADPRTGRGPMVSFDAKSAWMKWPLDQIYFQTGFALSAFEVLPVIGSDHYPVMADLCIEEGGTLTLRAPKADDLGIARETISRARALPGAAPSAEE
ncbi:endonuclease/exonuclease/phosphatase family protein [Profundibacterium mesophilum]|uniref:Endonuclease/exonuclease/phosphatase domain-containing protein n=1 Tax=Profundibacterium mesophilum KAUST100406-0324 TaxID=1037889 RepID=A0A921NTL9_9RHOB|nr:endonuclease/exonuclease/phosphatase family protein [Profundibacterium mesophilum]KAF0674951.1 hypothetical protein PMES_02660 [Profundibacterium mesophilum KAUST100406-0324]